MSAQNGYRCPYCLDRFETQARLDQHVPCPEPNGDGQARLCAEGCGLLATDGDRYCEGCRDGHERNRTYDDPDRLGGN